MILCQATTTQHLQSILRLQEMNLKEHLSDEQRAREGFLTVKHSPALLRQMNTRQKHIIALDHDQLAGYALSMDATLQTALPVLAPMFQRLRHLQYRGRPLTDHSFYIMGQICIAAPYRGKGIFKKLYEAHKTFYSSEFDLLITEVSGSNLRSLHAHEKIGFQTLETYRDQTDNWHLIAWDWKTVS